MLKFSAFSLTLFAVRLIQIVSSSRNCITLASNIDISLNDVKPLILNITQEFSVKSITSPEYSDERYVTYPLNILCAWNINAPKGELIEINFDKFDLQMCPWDFLRVRDGPNSNSTIIADLCGYSIPSPIISSGNSLYLTFISDDFLAYRGFKLNYKIHTLAKQCQPNEFKCRNNNCVAMCKKCDKYDDCGDGTDEEDCRYKLSLWPNECGSPKIKPILDNGDRIVGGQTAANGSWPWMASLRIRDTHSCGAVLINHQWVVSAAHCFLYEKNITSFTLYFGKFLKQEHENTEVMRYVDKIILHPQYLPLLDEKFSNRKDNDIALLKLNAPIFFNDYISPICLPNKYVGTLKDGSVCQVTGWGHNDFESYDRLKQAAVPIVNSNKCIENYQNYYVINPEIMICAGYSEGGHDSCQGDSGGPLSFQLKNKWFLIGIVSSGGVNGCGQEGMPGIYTKVRPFVNWIQKIVRQNCDPIS